MRLRERRRAGQQDTWGGGKKGDRVSPQSASTAKKRRVNSAPARRLDCGSGGEGEKERIN